MEEAKFELDETIEYYNAELPGLGDLFLSEVLESLDRFARFSDAWHQLSENTRRCQTKRFPFGIIYSVLDGEILIVSVSNLHREPNHWQGHIR